MEHEQYVNNPFSSPVGAAKDSTLIATTLGLLQRRLRRRTLLAMRSHSGKLGTSSLGVKMRRGTLRAGPSLTYGRVRKILQKIRHQVSKR